MSDLWPDSDETVGEHLEKMLSPDAQFMERFLGTCAAHLLLCHTKMADGGVPMLEMEAPLPNFYWEAKKTVKLRIILASDFKQLATEGAIGRTVGQE